MDFGYNRPSCLLKMLETVKHESPGSSTGLLYSQLFMSSLRRLHNSILDQSLRYFPMSYFNNLGST